MKKALIFDCDGTLLDTRGDYMMAMNDTLVEFGYHPITLEQITLFLGYGTDYLVKHSLKAGGASERIFDQFKPVYLKRYFTHVFVKTKEYPNTTKMLLLAKEKGYKIAVASNKPDPALHELISKAFPAVPFDLVTGQVEGTIPKPDRYMFDKVLKRLDLRPEEVCYFGDTEVDYQFAKNADVKDLYLFEYGFRDKEYLLANTKPKAFLKDMNDLIALIKNGL